MTEESKPTIPKHDKLLAKAIREGSVSGVFQNQYPDMYKAILKTQDQVLFGVTPEWQQWAKDSKDRTVFSGALAASSGEVYSGESGVTKHRMILSPVPKWDDPSCQPFILTSCAPNLFSNVGDNKTFIKDGRLLCEEYYQARYRQAYAQLSLSKEAGKTDYYRFHKAGFGFNFPPLYEKDKPTAIYLTSYAYQKAAKELGMTVHSILWSDDESSAQEKERLEKIFPPNGALKFEVGTMDKVEQHWGEKAVFENSGSDLSVGGPWWNLDVNGMEQQIARNYALIETQSTTLNPNVRALHELNSENSVLEVAKSNFYIINPPEPGPAPKLPSTELTESNDEKEKPPIHATSSSPSSSVSQDPKLEIKEKKESPIPLHSASLQRLLQKKSIDSLQKSYPDMHAAIAASQKEVSVGVTPEWEAWAQTVQDPSIFSQALKVNVWGQQVGRSREGCESTKHRMILGPAPKWDKPSCRPYILTSCAPNLRDEGGDIKQFIDEKGRVRLQEYYQARYHQAYAQLSFIKAIGKTHYYRSHLSGLGGYFPQELSEDKKAAIYLTSYAYRKAAEKLGITVHSIIWPGEKGKQKKLAEAEKIRLEQEFSSEKGPLKFEVGSLQEAIDQHWDSQEGAVFENAGSDTSVGNTCLGNTEGLVEQALAMEFAIVETHSTTLNTALRDRFPNCPGKGTFHRISPRTAEPMPSLPPYCAQPTESKDKNNPPPQSTPVDEEQPYDKKKSPIELGSAFFPPKTVKASQSNTPPQDNGQQATLSPWTKIFIGALIFECVMVAIPLMVAGFAELAKTQHASNFGASDVKDFFFGSPEANFMTGLGLTIAIGALIVIAAKSMQSRCCQDDELGYQSQP